MIGSLYSAQSIKMHLDGCSQSEHTLAGVMGTALLSGKNSHYGDEEVKQ